MIPQHIGKTSEREMNEMAEESYRQITGQNPVIPQPQHPDDLFMITRDELDRCCSQMSAAGYKVSANYVEASVLSRPAPSPRIDVSKCFEDIIYSSSPWKIYRQDAGMGEHDYAVFLDDVFYCRTEDSQTAMRIVNTMRRTEGGEH